MSFDAAIAEIIRNALQGATGSLSHKQLKEVCNGNGATDAAFLCALTGLVNARQVTKSRKPVGHGMLRQMTDCYDLVKVPA